MHRPYIMLPPYTMHSRQMTDRNMTLQVAAATLQGKSRHLIAANS